MDTARDPDPASTASPPNFNQQFRRRINALQEQVDSLSIPEASPSDRQATIDVVRVGLARLSSELADVSGGLASYDQRSYIQAIKDLQDKLTTVRAPKAKFSFKKRLAPSEANSASTSRSATPNPGDPTPALASPPRIQDELDDEHLILLNAKRDAYFKPSTDGKTCIVSDVSSSILDLVRPSGLTLNTIDNSLILAPEVKGAAHMTGLRNSILVLTCHQFRMHRSHNVDVYLHCPNRPIIEDCSNIRFARMPVEIQPATGPNLFDQVDDFKWLRNEASPNWRVMRNEEGIKKETWQGVLEAIEKQGEELDTQILRDLKVHT